MKIEITDGNATTLSGVSKRTGNDYELHLQKAYLHVSGGKYPESFEVMLPRDRQGKPYAIGMYEVNADSFEIRDSRLVFNNYLVPIKG